MYCPGYWKRTIGFDQISSFRGSACGHRAHWRFDWPPGRVHVFLFPIDAKCLVNSGIKYRPCSLGPPPDQTRADHWLPLRGLRECLLRRARETSSLANDRGREPDLSSGVRPNSPMARTTVESSRPRSSRSSRRTERVRSSGGAKRSRCP